MPFKEIVLGWRELHFHIDVDTGEPLRMYRYASDVKPEYVAGTDYADEECEAVFTARYRKGKNPLFVYMVGKDAIAKAWRMNLHWATPEDLDGINFKQHPA